MSEPVSFDIVTHTDGAGCYVIEVGKKAVWNVEHRFKTIFWGYEIRNWLRNYKTSMYRVDIN